MSCTRKPIEKSSVTTFNVRFRGTAIIAKNLDIMPNTAVLEMLLLVIQMTINGIMENHLEINKKVIINLCDLMEIVISVANLAIKPDFADQVTLFEKSQLNQLEKKIAMIRNPRKEKRRFHLHHGLKQKNIVSLHPVMLLSGGLIQVHRDTSLTRIFILVIALNYVNLLELMLRKIIVQ